MEFSFEARVILELEHKPGWSTAKHVGTKFNLKTSSELDKRMYMDKNDILNNKGSESLTNVLIQGLIGNIHMAHQQGFRNDAEHLRYIISELERGFVAIVEVGISEF
jgi:hypothetical protein